MHKIINVSVLQDYQLKLEFDDGKAGIVDLSHLVGKGVFFCGMITVNSRMLR